jgi:hypothetical protein
MERLRLVEPDPAALYGIIRTWLFVFLLYRSNSVVNIGSGDLRAAALICVPHYPFLDSRLIAFQRPDYAGLPLPLNCNTSATSPAC